jgi:hypothetical protein
MGTSPAVHFDQGSVKLPATNNIFRNDVPEVKLSPWQPVPFSDSFFFNCDVAQKQLASLPKEATERRPQVRSTCLALTRARSEDDAAPQDQPPGRQAPLHWHHDSPRAGATGSNRSMRSSAIL